MGFLKESFGRKFCSDGIGRGLLADEGFDEDMLGGRLVASHSIVAYTVMGFHEQQSDVHDNRHRLLLLITRWQLE
eukprot:scaffold117024_cov35-Attheya_sp.AAC.1